MLTLVLLASLLAGSDPDGVVSTAPRGADSVVVGAVAPTTDARPDASMITPMPQSLTTAEQIDRWVGARTAANAPFESDRGPVDDRKMHGFASGAVGTGDFSAVAVGVSLPIGENGRLDLSFSQSRNGYGYGGYGDYGYGYQGYGYDGLGYRGYRPTDFYGHRPLAHDPFFSERVRVAGSDIDRRERDPDKRP
ncbi:hypothetical protein [Brevundimonas subvibrioides]|uniref:Uncharacterized protein n=1 Tax=Brevundimonas subvibrioides (strain ATCC 15264 / DSM 4735 / LMG 14903 / NBRC 16000 / CB 81) TaxID=633149 RepID=D9QJJ8_BRESC|nr:hypothetical protein [Brevundimonas subvibrioides]ADL01559.1 hypothetical protein Bresu_2249 [Brevundimonas subvibrioides ATCC 15264]